MRYRFQLVIYQNDVLDERSAVDQEFGSDTDVLRAIVQHAAKQAGMNAHPADGPGINLPRLVKGYSVHTVVVVTSITRLDDGLQIV